MRRVLPCAVLALALAPHLAEAAPSCPAAAKISVLRGGRFLVDGSAVTMPVLNARFAALEKSHGVVWYYRESADDGAMKTAKPLIDAVIAHRLPISFSGKPDFSDVIVESSDGTSHSEPRNRCERP